MNIALFSSPVHTVPPNEKNILAPWELVAALANGLVDRGHHVSLFAPKGSKTKATLYDGGIAPVILEKERFSDTKEYQSYVHARSLELFRYMSGVVQTQKIDVIHVHQAIEQFLPALDTSIPIVCTFHDVVDSTRFAALSRVAMYKNIHFVGISTAQFAHTPFSAAVVYNGVDPLLYPYENDPQLDDHPLLIVGRIVPEKGFGDAIAAARESGVRLMIVGQRYGEYFDQEILPQVDGKMVIWEPVVKRQHLVGHYQTARALLFPIHWEEPFGLVMIEAMACGTPVIAYNRGSVPEIVRDGVTGFIVEEKKGVPGLVTAIKRIGKIDREACRKHVENNFTIDHMVDGYEKVYASMLR